MGTRGLFGFRKNKQDKLCYNHYDSYPDGLGIEIMDYIKSHTNEKMNEVYDDIKLFNNDKPIKDFTKEEYEEYKHILKEFGIKENLKGINNYDTLNDLISTSIKYGRLSFYDNKKSNERLMCDDNDFIKDSLFCEWAYIINLDTNNLEIWKGFQTKPQKDNRYGNKCYKVRSGEKYYPCVLISEIPFDDLRKQCVNSLEDFIPMEKDDY